MEQWSSGGVKPFLGNSSSSSSRSSSGGQDIFQIPLNLQSPAMFADILRSFDEAFIPATGRAIQGVAGLKQDILSKHWKAQEGSHFLRWLAEREYATPYHVL